MAEASDNPLICLGIALFGFVVVAFPVVTTAAAAARPKRVALRVGSYAPEDAGGAEK